MEVKSRYEVLSGLEAQKRQLIIEKASLDDEVRIKEVEIRNLKRDLSDKEEDLENFKSNLDNEKKTKDMLIATVEEGLKRFNLDKKS